MKFGYHPINLGLRFLLELTTFIAVGYYGYVSQVGITKYITMLGLPIILAVLWGIFATPNDKSRSGKTVIKTPGLLRLLIELVVFGAGVLAFSLLHLNLYALLFSAIVVVHYLLSIDRVTWLLREKIHER